jgi:hypothetical protein
VKHRVRCLVAAALGLCASQLPAQEPGRLGLEKAPSLSVAPRSANQQLADAVARAIRQSGQLHGFHIDVVCQGGLVEVSGTVVDQPQHEELLRLIQGVPGVERVLDRLTLTEGLRLTQAAQPPELQPPPTGPFQAPPPLAGPLEAPPALQPAPNGGVPEPKPIFQAPAPTDLNPPRMPPYAWPTYAPYNNFSRVAYPLAYPYNSWPFIGPCYPFPKVPLGWRSVKLKWEDGYWWYSRVATKYDWWRLRYW